MHPATVDWSMSVNSEFRPAMKSFRRYLEDQGIRESTIELYVGNAQRYLKYAGTDRPSPQDWENFRAHICAKKLSRSTLNQYAYSVKAYHEMTGGQISIKRLEPNNQIPYYFDKDDIIQILNECRNLKHYAMLSVLFYACLRASELCKIDDSDVDLKVLTIRIREGKGGKDAIIPINNECAKVLKEYLAIKPPLVINNSKPLFYTQQGKRWNRTEVSRMFAHYKKKAHIQKRGGVHVFARHTPATIMIANGCDIRIVQKILRHNDIRTTLRYAHVSDKTQREAHEKFLIL